MTDPFATERSAIAQRIAAAGKIFNEETIANFAPLYAALHARTKKPAVKISRDISYGPHPQRHLLDIHTLEGASEGAKPIVIFFHGGGLVRGNKDGGGPFYANFGSFFAANGAVGINATYRLAPEIQWPEGARDVGAAAAWAAAHAAEFGGDPRRIILVGHSAGATHVASYIYRPGLHSKAGPNFSAAILMSGVYGIDVENPPANHRAYYGEDRSKYSAMQIVGNVDACKFPVLVTVAEYDPLRFESGAYKLLAELVEKGAPNLRVKQFLGHNHISPALATGTGDKDIEDTLLAFLASL